MPTQTPNLKLDTYNNTTDAQAKFQTWRSSVAGDQTSSLTKIDKWAGDVNAKLASLENNKPTILVKGTWISTGYYESTSQDIVDFKLDMLVTVKLNQDNDGTLTIKINELPVKSFLKYDTTGVLVNLEVGDLRKEREYQFRYDGTAFVWQGGTSSDQLNITGTTGNIVKIATDNTIDDSGIAIGYGTLNTTDKSIVGGINELKSDKIDKAQIKNTLTEVVVGNVLDSTQGKILNEKIGDTGILTTTDKTSTVAAINELDGEISILSALQNGFKFYKLLSEIGCTTSSTTQQLIEGMSDKSVLIIGENYADIPYANSITIITKFNSGRVDCNCSYNLSKHYKGSYHSASGFSGWKQLATTDKIDISLPYLTGFSDYDDSYKTIISKDTLGRVVCNFYVKSTSNFTSTYVTVGNLPAGFKPKAIIECVCRGSGNMYGLITIDKNGRVQMSKMGGTSESVYLSASVTFDGI